MNMKEMRMMMLGLAFGLGGLVACPEASAAATRYVVTPEYALANGVVPTEPYTSWETAGTNIATVAAYCQSKGEGDTIYVRVGTYKINDRIFYGNSYQYRKLDIISYDPDNGGKPNRDKTILDGQGKVQIMWLFSTAGHRCSFVVDGFTFKNGYSANNGGALYFSGARMRTDGPVPSRGFEGGVYNCRFVDNYAATQGGAIEMLYGGIVSNCVFESNTSGKQGAAVHVSYGNAASGDSPSLNLNDPETLDRQMHPASNGTSYLAYFDSCTFSNNVAGTENANDSGFGAAVCAEAVNNAKQAVKPVYVRGCTFVENRTLGKGNRGGGVYAGYGSRIEDAVCISNRANYGASIYLLGQVDVVSNCVVTGCNGAFGAVNTAGMLVDCVLTGNTECAWFFGGTNVVARRTTFACNGKAGVHQESGSLLLDACTVFSNACGGVEQKSGVETFLRLRNCLVARNGWSKDYGVNIQYAGVLENCTVVDNGSRGVNFSGAANGFLALTNCVLAVPNPETAGAWAYYIPPAASNQCVAVNTYGFNTKDIPSVNPVTGDVRFVDPRTSDYRLQKRSCLRDKALTLGWMTADATDLDKKPRRLDRDAKATPEALADVGCYECDIARTGMLLLVR